MTLDDQFAAAMADSLSATAFTPGTPENIAVIADIADIVMALQAGVAAADLAVAYADLTSPAGITAAVAAAEYQAKGYGALADLLTIG